MIAGYLIDASAFYPLILKLREKILDHLQALSILDLTIYEVENAIVKSAKKGLLRDAKNVAATFEDIIKSMQIIRVEPELAEVIELALKENLTSYDAYYLYTARKNGLKLVTEDKTLLGFPEATTTDKMLSELIQV